jgi:hypothetical protein
MLTIGASDLILAGAFAPSTLFFRRSDDFAQCPKASKARACSWAEGCAAHSAEHCATFSHTSISSASRSMKTSST